MNTCTWQELHTLTERGTAISQRQNLLHVYQKHKGHQRPQRFLPEILQFNAIVYFFSPHSFTVGNIIKCFHSRHPPPISTHWATYVFSSQLLDALDQNSLLLADLDPRDLENMCAARHPDEGSEVETKVVSNLYVTDTHIFHLRKYSCSSCWTTLLGIATSKHCGEGKKNRTGSICSVWTT